MASIYKGKRKAILLGAVVVGALALAACGGGDGGSAPTPTATATAGSGAQVTPGSTVVLAEDAAPDFPIFVYQGEEYLGGTELTLHEMLALGKPVVLNFWAGLCPPCRAEMPDLQKVHNRFKDDILLFGLDVGPFMLLGSRDDAKGLLDELAVTYPAGSTEDANVVRAYEIRGMPSTFFIKANGEIFRKWTGLLTEGKMAEIIGELLEA